MVTWEHLEIPPAHTTRCPSQSSSLHSCWPQPCHHFPSHRTCTRWCPWAARSANHPPARTGALHHRWCPRWSEALGYPGKGPQGKLLLSPSSIWFVGCGSGWINSWKLFGTIKSDHLPKCKIHQKPAFHPWFSTTSHPQKKQKPQPAPTNSPAALGRKSEPSSGSRRPTAPCWEWTPWIQGHSAHRCRRCSAWTWPSGWCSPPKRAAHLASPAPEPVSKVQIFCDLGKIWKYVCRWIYLYIYIYIYIYLYLDQCLYLYLIIQVLSYFVPTAKCSNLPPAAPWCGPTHKCAWWWSAAQPWSGCDPRDGRDAPWARPPAGATADLQILGGFSSSDLQNKKRGERLKIADLDRTFPKIGRKTYKWLSFERLGKRSV